MKKTLKIVIIVFVIIILSIAAWQFYKLFNKNKVYESELKVSDAKISLYSDTIVILREDTAKLLKRIDSLSTIVLRGKSEMVSITKKIKLLESEKLNRYQVIEDMTELEQVKHFISFTKQDYEPVMHNGFYLISIESIKFANNAFLDSEFNLKNNLLLIEQIESLNNIMFSQDQQIKTFLDYKLATDKMLTMKDLIIAENNTKFGIQNGKLKNYKKQRNIAYIAAVVAIVLNLIK